MPIRLHESTSTRKSINITVTPSASGVTISGSVRWFDDAYTIPAVVIPCTFTDVSRYRVALCSSPPRIVLIENGGTVADEVCSPVHWAFSGPSDTCATVDIHVTKRVYEPEEPQTAPTPHAVSATPDLLLLSLEDRLAKVDAQTAATIANGFAFSGKTISLSVESQTTIQGAHIIRASLPYPLKWSTIDNDGFVTLASAADVEALYAAATSAVLVARNNGNVKKQAIIDSF